MLSVRPISFWRVRLMRKLLPMMPGRKMMGITLSGGTGRLTRRLSVDGVRAMVAPACPPISSPDFR
ncbi:hypothetical protein D9M70_514900 [compost metagenome]